MLMAAAQNGAKVCAVSYLRAAAACLAMGRKKQFLAGRSFSLGMIHI
jgi:hypothetical protein